MSDTRGPVIIAIGYLVLMGFIIIWIGAETDSFSEFSQYWGLFGLLVGVATGAIPSFFFNSKANKEAERAAAESKKAQLFAAAAPHDLAMRITTDNAELFR